MAFALNSKVDIGIYSDVKPHEVWISKSIFEYVDKAKLKYPITARIIRAGNVITESVATAKVFNEGDKVTVQLGYNGSLKTEFEGFISRLNFTTPLEVECEGYSYQLRFKNVSGTMVKVQLVELLRSITAGTDIVLDEKNIPGFIIDKVILTGKTALDVLEEIKKTSGQLIKFFFTGKTLWAGLQYLDYKGTVKYKMGWNVIKDGNLKLHQAQHEQTTVNWIGEMKDGTKVTATTGNKGTVKIKSTHAITDKNSLQQLSDAEHRKLSYDGYEGKITAFGLPYCEPGDVAEIIDEKYPERGGRYIVQSTEVKYSMGGFRRTVGIGEKL
ncbi:MAG: hypothetical protein KGM16_17865 [Bacteroidota bacterium]|nr:hypothetical protein [Bacteroidota bacterium]